MKTNITILTIILLSIILIVLLTRINHKQSVFIENQKGEIDKSMLNNDLLLSNLVMNWETMLLHLKDTCLIDQIIQTKSYNDPFPDCPILIFHFIETNCSTCVQKQITILNDLALEKSLKIAIISSFEDLKNFELFRNRNKLNFPIYNSASLFVEENATPCYFLLSKSHQVSCFFHPLDEYPELTTKYLNLMSIAYD